MSGLRSRFSVLMSMLTAVVAMVMAGCAMTPADNDGWRESQRAILKSRAEARWQSLINGEFDKAYSYLSPEYRAVVNLQQYKGKFGRVLAWRLARADDIRYDSPTVASVSVEVTYRLDLPGARGEQIENKKVLAEKWLYRDGGWWYTDQ